MLLGGHLPESPTFNGDVEQEDEEEYSDSEPGKYVWNNGIYVVVYWICCSITSSAIYGRWVKLGSCAGLRVVEALTSFTLALKLLEGQNPLPWNTASVTYGFPHFTFLRFPHVPV